jgi:hypothetical protein
VKSLSEFKENAWTDVLLVFLFGLQHTVMASDVYKNVFSQMQPMLRTMYVFVSAACLIVSVPNRGFLVVLF